MERLNLKPTHKPVQNYYEALRQFKTIGVAHEGAVRSAFQTLLDHCGRQFRWKLVPEWQIKRNHGHPLRVDGARQAGRLLAGDRQPRRLRRPARQAALPGGL